MKTCEHTDSYTAADGVVRHVECGNVAVVMFSLPDDEVLLCGAHWAEAAVAWEGVTR